ncbi:MAG: FixH family protein [Rhodospirillaceae bacterium]|nr:FixH family protein [Rhodospirillaceae bacterium]MDD9928307.1 FixH family protein [Rhodospirillaceae bacterium]
MRRKLTGRHVVFILLAMFGTIFAVNGVFAYFAVSGFPGVETQDAYRKGLAFNRQNADAARLKSLGWAMEVRREDADRLSMAFKKADGTPLAVSSVSADLIHPINHKGDRQLALNIEKAGSVSAPLSDIPPGQWQLRVTALGPNGDTLKFRRGIWLD